MHTVWRSSTSLNWHFVNDCLSCLDLGTNNGDFALLLKLKHAASDLVTFASDDTCSQYVKLSFDARYILFSAECTYLLTKLLFH